MLGEIEDYLELKDMEVIIAKPSFNMDNTNGHLKEAYNKT